MVTQKLCVKNLSQCIVHKVALFFVNSSCLLTQALNTFLVFICLQGDMEVTHSFLLLVVSNLTFT